MKTGRASHNMYFVGIVCQGELVIYLNDLSHFSKKSFDDSFHTSHISLLKLGPEKWNVIAEKNWLLKYP